MSQSFGYIGSAAITTSSGSCCCPSPFPSCCRTNYPRKYAASDLQVDPAFHGLYDAGRLKAFYDRMNKEFADGFVSNDCAVVAGFTIICIPLPFIMASRFGKRFAAVIEEENKNIAPLGLKWTFSVASEVECGVTVFKDLPNLHLSATIERVRFEAHDPTSRRLLSELLMKGMPAAPPSGPERNYM